MAKTAQVYLNIQVTGDSIDSMNIVPVCVSNVNSPAFAAAAALLAGDNVIVPPGTPTNTRYILIIPPIVSTVVKKFKAVAGDLGYVISPIQPTLISTGASPATFIINASGPELVEFYFF